MIPNRIKKGIIIFSSITFIIYSQLNCNENVPTNIVSPPVPVVEKCRISLDLHNTYLNNVLTTSNFGLDWDTINYPIDILEHRSINNKVYAIFSDSMKIRGADDSIFYYDNGLDKQLINFNVQIGDTTTFFNQHVYVNDIYPGNFLGGETVIEVTNYNFMEDTLIIGKYTDLYGVVFYQKGRDANHTKKV